MKHYYRVRVPKDEYIQNIISSVDLKKEVVYSFFKKNRIQQWIQILCCNYASK